MVNWWGQNIFRNGSFFLNLLLRLIFNMNSYTIWISNIIPLHTCIIFLQVKDKQCYSVIIPFSHLLEVIDLFLLQSISSLVSNFFCVNRPLLWKIWFLFLGFSSLSRWPWRTRKISSSAWISLYIASLHNSCSLPRLYWLPFSSTDISW